MILTGQPAAVPTAIGALRNAPLSGQIGAACRGPAECYILLSS